MLHIDKLFSELIQHTNRLIITGHETFDPKHKKSTPVLADIRNQSQINQVISLLEIIPENEPMNWFSITDYHLNFMAGKELLNYLGLIDWSILRLSDNSDYDLKDGAKLLGYLMDDLNIHELK